MAGKNDTGRAMSPEARWVELWATGSRAHRFPKYLLSYLDTVDDAVRSAYVLEDGQCTHETWTLLRQRREVGRIVIEFPVEFEANFGMLPRPAERPQSRTADGLFHDD